MADDKYTLTSERARELLDYNPETGDLTWKWRPEGPAKWNSKHAGKLAGGLVKNGYWQVRIYKTPYYAHRVAFLIYTSAWPTGEIDHIDGDRRNNAASNLRDVTHAANGRNQRMRVNNTSGIMGVRQTQYGTWEAYVQINGMKCNLGSFGTAELAAAAREAGNTRHDFHPNHGRARPARAGA
jgi:hypothetical protein